MRQVKFIAYDTEHEHWYSSEDVDELMIDELSTDGYVKYLQFTGYKDMNAKEIYEGHVCKQGTLILEVKFRYGCFFLCSPSDNGKIMNEGAIDFHHLAEQYEKKKERPFCKLEIIGHVLTHPGLLKKSS